MNIPQSITLIALVAVASISAYNYHTREPSMRYVESPSVAARAGPCMTVQGEVDRLCLKREALQTMSASEAIEFMKNDAELNHIWRQTRDHLEEVQRRQLEEEKRLGVKNGGPCVTAMTGFGFGMTLQSPRVECQRTPDDQARQYVMHTLKYEE